MAKAVAKAAAKAKVKADTEARKAHRRVKSELGLRIVLYSQNSQPERRAAALVVFEKDGATLQDYESV